MIIYKVIGKVWRAELRESHDIRAKDLMAEAL
jgi:hypothetical protein